MIIVESLYLIGLVLLGILSSLSDIRDGRIYNKMLLIFALGAISLGLVYYGYFARNLILLYLINFGVTALISLILFYTHSFAGGDCKLMLVMALLYPANFYLTYGRMQITLFFTLCIAIFYGYIYLLGYSIYELIRGKNKNYFKIYKGVFVHIF